MHACVYDGIFALFYAFSLLAFCNPKLYLLCSPHTKDKRITFQNVLLHSKGYKLVEMPLNDNGNFFHFDSVVDFKLLNFSPNMLTGVSLF